MTLVLIASLAVAFAQGRPQDREEVQRALIAEALRGDLDTAIRRYQTLVRSLPDTDPNWRLAVLSWARALYDEGRIGEARDALRMATRKGQCAAHCQSLLQLIAIDQESVRTLPVIWTFDNENPGLFHHWSRQELGELVAQPGALRWTTMADPRRIDRPDRLVVGFIRPEPPPTTVTFLVRSLGVPSWVRVQVEDEAGDRFVSPLIRLDTDEETQVKAELSDLQPVDPDTTLVPAEISRVSIEDLTGAQRAGPHTLAIVAFIAQ